MKGKDSTGAPLVHVPAWMDGWMDGSKSRFKYCLQQSKMSFNLHCNYIKVTCKCQSNDHESQEKSEECLYTSMHGQMNWTNLWREAKVKKH